MSSSRRRGRSPGTSASTVPRTAVPQPKAADIPASETSATEDAQPQDQLQEVEPKVAQEAVQDAVSEFVSEGQPPAEENALAERLTESVSTEAVLAVGALDDQAATEAAAAEADSAETVQAAGGSDEIVPADEPSEPQAAAPEADEAAQAAPPSPEPAPVEAVALVAEKVEQAVESVAEAVPAPAPVESVAGVKTAPRNVQIGASFAFAPSLAPLTEINAKLFAFARGEGEAALAHFQALTRAKSPAEAIRLQVTELQRAADASLTCFTEIVRSANRLSGSTHWH
ncbi:phasin family protein [Methylorubrum populi]